MLIFIDLPLLCWVQTDQKLERPSEGIRNYNMARDVWHPNYRGCERSNTTVIC